jgi:hypothetical protein
VADYCFPIRHVSCTCTCTLLQPCVGDTLSSTAFHITDKFKNCSIEGKGVPASEGTGVRRTWNTTIKGQTKPINGSVFKRSVRLKKDFVALVSGQIDMCISPISLVIARR